MSLKKTSMIYAVGNFSVLLIKFLFVPIYTFYLNQDELGWFDVITSTAPLLVFLFSLHIEMATLRWGLDTKNEDNKAKIFTNAITVLFIGISAFSLVYFSVNQLKFFQLPSGVSSINLHLYLLSVFVYIFFKQSIRSIKSSLQYVLMEILFTLGLVLFIYLFVIRGDYQVNGLLAAYSISTAIIFFGWGIFGKVISYFKPKLIDKGFIKELLGYSSPLVLNSINLWGLTYLIKYLILFFLSVASNGIFAVAYKLGFSIQIISNIFNMAWLDKAISSYKETDFKKSIDATFNKVFTLFFSVSVGVIAFQKLIVEWFIGKDFQESSNYIAILAVGFFFMGMGNFIGVIYQCEKNTISITKSSLTASISIVLFGLALINYFGLYGASAAFTIGNLIFFFYRYFDIQKYVHLKIKIYYYFLFPGIWIGFYILSQINTISLYIGVVGSILLFAYLNRALIQSVLKNKSLKAIS